MLLIRKSESFIVVFQRAFLILMICPNFRQRYWNLLIFKLLLETTKPNLSIIIRQKRNNARIILMNERCDFASCNTASNASYLEQLWKTALLIDKSGINH